jgi:hypothetical protein
MWPLVLGLNHALSHYIRKTLKCYSLAMVHPSCPNRGARLGILNACLSGAMHLVTTANKNSEGLRQGMRLTSEHPWKSRVICLYWTPTPSDQRRGTPEIPSCSLEAELNRACPSMRAGLMWPRRSVAQHSYGLTRQEMVNGQQ